MILKDGEVYRIAKAQSPDMVEMVQVESGTHRSAVPMAELLLDNAVGRTSSAYPEIYTICSDSDLTW